MRDAADRLEVGAVQSALAQRVWTPLGEAAVHAMGPLESRRAAAERIELIGQARELLQRESPAPVGGASDVRPHLELGEKGMRLDGEALRAVAKTMAVGAATRRFLLANEELVPGLFALGASLSDQQRSADEVLECFDPDGRLSDDASADLGPLRARLRSLHDKVEEKLQQLLHSERLESLLQESYFTVRSNRYVLPIKASFKNEVRGIVHDASGSGQTVFIEPQEIVDLGNRLKIAHSDVLEEEERILSDLTDMVVAEADETRSAIEVIRQIDLLMGCARFAEDLDCHAIVPSEVPGFRLDEARHPILALQKLEDPSLPLVANDLALEPGQKVLVLTGPNTGGKTVALKTVGLCAMLTRMGLHIPCGPRSQMGWFDRIDATIGDQQSIETHLSTFAAHMQDLIRILGRANDRALVLLDEIAADTDPMQGQALAQAVLESFADRSCHTVATTHFEQLKALPFSDDRFRNAGVGFDPNAMRPTYKVALDVPQSSSAMEIAESLGLSHTIVERARELTGEGNQALEELMRAVQEKTAELETARRDAADRALALDAERLKLEKQQEELAQLQQELIHGEREELLKELQAMRERARKTIAELQAAVQNDSVKAAMRLAQETAEELETARHEQAAKLESPEDEEEERPGLDAVQVGQWVRVKRLDKDGEVVAVDNKGVLVAVGAMRMRVTLSGLEAPMSKRPRKTRSRSTEIKRALEEAKVSTEDAVITSDQELDLRGATVEEAQHRIDAFLDHHYQGPATQVRIIHGHGTGVLKRNVRELLTRSGYAKSWRPGKDHEGGDGATIVSLV